MGVCVVQEWLNINRKAGLRLAPTSLPSLMSDGLRRESCRLDGVFVSYSAEVAVLITRCVRLNVVAWAQAEMLSRV